MISQIRYVIDKGNALLIFIYYALKEEENYS